MFLFNFLIIYLFDKCLLCVYYVVEIVLNVGDMVVNKINFFFNWSLFFVGGNRVGGGGIGNKKI